jgi:hypothetical protein
MSRPAQPMGSAGRETRPAGSGEMQPPQGRDLLFPRTGLGSSVGWPRLGALGAAAGWELLFLFLDVTSRLTGLTSDGSKLAE